MRNNGHFNCTLVLSWFMILLGRFNTSTSDFRSSFSLSLMEPIVELNFGLYQIIPILIRTNLEKNLIENHKPPRCAIFYGHNGQVESFQYKMLPWQNSSTLGFSGRFGRTVRWPKEKYDCKLSYWYDKLEGMTVTPNKEIWVSAEVFFQIMVHFLLRCKLLLTTCITYRVHCFHYSEIWIC